MAGGRKRPGFTLLEMLIATAIGVLLLLALYVAFETQLRYVDTGREVVEESTLARALLSRIGQDISASLPLVPPPKKSTSSGSSGSQESSTGQGGVVSGAGPFNFGVQGNLSRLVLFISRLPSEHAVPSETPPLASDLRRVTWWLAADGRGLARYEARLVTADDMLNSEGDESVHVVAEEVAALEFRYFDGSTWQESWDGTVTAANSNAPIGPPLAIEIRIGILPANQRRFNGPPDMLGFAEPTLKYYRHVAAIPTANGSSVLP